MSLFRTDLWYNASLLRLNPDKFFVFGDNILRSGKGGQAIIRDEPNAVGLVTKFFPHRDADSYFNDSRQDLEVMLKDVAFVLALSSRRDVIIPFSTRVELGTGLSQLPERAPTLYAVLQLYFTADMPVADLPTW